MKTAMPSLFVSAALAGMLAAVPASADHHEGKGKEHKHHKAKKEKKAKGMPKVAADEKVHCLGVNACKGKSECAVDGGHACAGHNACKGQGWVTLTRKDCAARKGSVQGEKAAEAPERAAKPAKAEKPAEKPAGDAHKH